MELLNMIITGHSSLDAVPFIIWRVCCLPNRQAVLKVGAVVPSIGEGTYAI